jgi:hypothetical protein
MRRVYEYITGDRKGRLKLGRAHNRWSSGEDPSELDGCGGAEMEQEYGKGGELK